MYRCKDCGKKFNRFKKNYEGSNSLGELRYYDAVCPFCESENIEKEVPEYCRCCGRKLPENRKDYCSVSCRKNGMIIYENQLKRYFALKSSPLFSVVREIDDYNKEHGTSLSYGQYVALVVPQKEKEKKNGRERRKGKVSEKLPCAVGKNRTA